MVVSVRCNKPFTVVGYSKALKQNIVRPVFGAFTFQTDCLSGRNRFANGSLLNSDQP